MDSLSLNLSLSSTGIRTICSALNEGWIGFGEVALVLSRLSWKSDKSHLINPGIMDGIKIKFDLERLCTSLERIFMLLFGHFIYPVKEDFAIFLHFTKSESA